jgi:excisionase family DNA binding protein
MQAYASPATGSHPQLRLLTNHSISRSAVTAGVVADHSALVEQLLMQLAEVVADRVVAQLMGPRDASVDGWLDTRGAAEYLGISRDTVRRLAAERAIPTEQAGAGCKLYFRRDELDNWRRVGRSPNQAGPRGGVNASR